LTCWCYSRGAGYFRSRNPPFDRLVYANLVVILCFGQGCIVNVCYTDGASISSVVLVDLTDDAVSGGGVSRCVSTSAI
jgi:hypothetical protein